jgi:molecular chaperone HscB
VTNHFTSFDFDATFSIDLPMLEQRYEQLMAICHPDRYIAAPTFEQNAAAKRAADINEAYNVLKHPVDRAGHLLQLWGVELSVLERQPAEPEFLFEQMLLREKVQEFETLSADSAAGLVADIDAAYKQTQEKFITYFEAGDVTRASAAWVEFHFQQKLSDELKRARDQRG